MEQWKDMLENRGTTFAWSDKEVTKETIQSILDDLHNYVPSKQAMMPYTITVLDWSNPTLRKEIFQHTHRDGDRNVTTDLGNPQTLAPWLLAFTPRMPVEDEEVEQYDNVDNANHDPMSYFRLNSNLEIGIASSFIVWSAAARGLNTGYCGCLNELPGSLDHIAKLLNPGIFNPVNPSVLLGIGIKDPNATTYKDPRIGKEKELPTNEHANLRRPEQNLYVNWMTK